MLRKAPFVLALTVLTALPVSARDPSGAYLAGRQASFSSDFKEAARYYARALMQDRTNPELMESTLLAFLALGQLKEAYPIALNLARMQPDNQAAALVLAADLLGPEGNTEEPLPRIGPVADGLLNAWRALERGQTAEAFAGFDAMIGDDRLRAFGSYHKALALAHVGDFEGADEIFSMDGGATAFLTRRGALAHTQVLSQLGKFEEARALADRVFGVDDPRTAALHASLEAGEAQPFDVIPTPRDGYAESFYSVAVALNGQASDGFTLLYTRLAEYLSPGNIDAILMSAGLLEQMGRYELATEAYDRVPRDSAAYLTAEVGRAGALRMADKPDAAVEVLTQLSETHPDVSTVHIALGDTLRRMSRFEAAADAYDRAIALFETSDPGQWPVYYARGIVFERTDQWDKAEPDFRKALELNPGQPNVLNYLGYSFVEMGENLDEALNMIEEAVAARPEDGYITDSLGWVLYRLGRYEEAVAPMERAVELMPLDPIINDHLGDVLWAVGRKREADFQWRRALSFEPEEEDAERIRAKIANGLDAVLAAEGAAPINVANDG